MKNIAGKIFFVIGIIVILLILAWVILTFLPKIFNSLTDGNFGNKDENSILISTDSTIVKNNEIFYISWESESESGDYYITYECTEDLILTYINTGNKRIMCDAPFMIENGTNDAQLSARLDKVDSFMDLPITIEFIPEGKTKAQKSGEVVVTLQSDNNVSPTVDISETDTTPDPADESIDNPPTTTVENPVTTPTPVPTNRPTDLVISNITSTPNSRTVQFTTTNMGDIPTGTWVFSYNLPTIVPTVYTSPIQPSLNGGQSLRSTITFDGSPLLTSNISIKLDSTNVVIESNENNNVGNVIYYSTN